MYTEALLNLLNPNWRDLWVDVITFPCPPTPAKSVLYAADAWRSDAVERGIEVFQAYHEHSIVMAGQFTGRGPAFLIRRKLTSLLSIGSYGVTAPQPIYCAKVSYVSMFESGRLRYANDVILEGVSAISQSCHPASHTVVPDAPYLTAFLELRYADDGRELPHDFIFADHVSAGQYFPKHDFHGNMEVDTLFRYLTLQDCLVGNKDKAIMLYPVISQRLRQVISESLIANSNLAQKYPNVERYVQAVTAFQSLIHSKEQAHD